MITYSQELNNKKVELEAILEEKLADLKMKRKWVRELELEIESIENRINAIDSELREAKTIKK